MSDPDRYTRLYKLRPGERIEIDAGTPEEITVELVKMKGGGQQVRLVVGLPHGRAVRKGGPPRSGGQQDSPPPGPPRKQTTPDRS